MQMNMKRKNKTAFDVECAVKISCFVILLFDVPKEREGLSELLCGFDACDFGNYSTNYVSM